MFDEAKVLKVLMSGDARYADVFAEERTYTHIQLESGRVEKLERGEDRGIGLRVIMPWKTYLASTTADDQRNLLELARDLAGAAGHADGPGPGVLTIAKAGYPFTLEVPAGGVAMEKKLALVRRLEAAARSMEGRIRQARVVYRDTRQSVRIASGGGLMVSDCRDQVVLNLLLVGEKDGDIQTAYDAIGGFYGFEYFTDERVEELVRTTVTRLSGLLDAGEAPMGTKTVVLASEAGGTMIHEAIGHGLEADLAMEGLSVYKGQLGAMIASPLITVVDDKTIPHLRGTYAYDDEGVAAERTVLVDQGVLKNYLFDRFQAMKHGRLSTANGRRESFRFRPIPRMSNTMILPGKDDPSAIIASVDDGVLVRKMGGGQVDTVRGDFVFEISEGYLIEKGKVGPMIKNATMMGNGPKVLREIDMVGSDFGFGIGTCGKDGQGVPVSDAQPTLRIPNIIVGGRAG